MGERMAVSVEARGGGWQYLWRRVGVDGLASEFTWALLVAFEIVISSREIEVLVLSFRLNNSLQYKLTWAGREY
jgi:hypothetical protein